MSGLIGASPRAVYNHRISALKIEVDLHDEVSFQNLARTFDQEFGRDNSYQASIDRWNKLYECYEKMNGRRVCMIIAGILHP